MKIAAETNTNPEVMEVLLKAGADIEVSDKYGETPLLLAVDGEIVMENPEVIDALLKAGADVNAKDVDGRTPLSRAVEFSANPEVIEALLKVGANARAKDKEGKTAADHAKDSEKIYKTKVYEKLNELQYE
mgnify:CR=1 FL=1